VAKLVPSLHAATTRLVFVSAIIRCFKDGPLFVSSTLCNVYLLGVYSYDRILRYIRPAPAGNPLHVSVFDGDGNAIDDSTVTWTGLPSTCMVAVDPAGGFIFTSSTTGVVVVTAKVGAASAAISLNFKGLKFTGP
jgi:hypothetical protein